MPTSFGIEFEFDLINENRFVSHAASFEHRLSLDNWWRSDDRTAAVEICTPPYTSIGEAVENIKEQFNLWFSNFQNVAPYPVSREGVSLGQHVHLGRPRRRLYTNEKKKIARVIAVMYPWLAALHAQPIPSRRGLGSTYIRPIWNYGYEIPDPDHYCEISDSSHGTVEFRIFDANIPQVTLTCVWLMQCLATKALRRDEEINRDRYRADRQNGLQFGLAGLNTIQYLTYVRNVCGNLQIPDFDFLREILYLAARYSVNPYQIMDRHVRDRYNYFKAMFSNPDKYIENLLGLEDVNNVDWLERVKAESHQVRTLDELIGIARASFEAFRRAIEEAEVSILPKNGILPRQVVAEALDNNDFYITRIGEVRGWSVNEVAERISMLLERHGEGFVAVKTGQEIIEDSARYYVLAVCNPNGARDCIAGCIAIKLRTGEIQSLVVDRRYRRLGIAKLLLAHALNTIVSNTDANACTYVREGNTAAMRLFENFGFRPVFTANNCVRMVRE